jgi:outer membrane protein OmpA-like peptidoglycan-associated protein
MKRGTQILLLLFFGYLSAQEKGANSVYFEFDKFTINEDQISCLTDLLMDAKTPFDAIQLFGYCDDRGSADYNDILSMKRVATVQKILITNGIPLNKIFICEGRGRVIIAKDSLKNLQKIRDKNRRVDLIFIKNPIYSFFPENPKVGDIINLNKIIFDMGSSVLSLKAKRELDKYIVSLQKYKSLRFEIRGHVCCTPSKYKDAIDEETEERNLSINRAKNVFTYLRIKGVNPYRMNYKGYGNQFPLGKTDELDRRVEFFIIKN